MKELYPGEYADLQERAQNECEAATQAAARLAALPPGTPEYATAELDSYYGDLAAGHAIWNVLEFEQANGLPPTPIERFWQATPEVTS
ncbi:MAG TPA: hypothetical protein VF276_10140 [Chloroflexia bacterium]